MGFSGNRRLSLPACVGLASVFLASCGGDGGGTAPVMPVMSVSSPGTPSSVTDVASNGQVVISWAAVVGATNYNVERALASTGPFTLLKSTTATSYTDQAVTNGVTYYYTVTASNAAGASSPSAVIAASPVVPAPVPIASAPTGLIASAAAGGVSLVWNLSDGAAGYSIYRHALVPATFFATAGLGPNSAGLVKVGTSVNNFYLDTTALPGSDYLYVVTSVNAGGESAVSDHSCSSPAAGGVNVPPVRPRVFMAAHGTNLIHYGTSSYIQDPTPTQLTAVGASFGDLLEAGPDTWAYVATCLDGIWGNYALDFPPGTSPANFSDQISLYGDVNTRNTIAEYDFSGSSLASLRLPTDVNISGPQTSASGPIVLNREAIEMYSGPQPTNWDPFTIAEVGSLYIDNLGAPAWALFPKIYTGFNLNSWTYPWTVSPEGGIGIFSVPSATAAFNAGKGNIQECNIDCSESIANYKQGFLNNLIATHLNGNVFILFFTVGCNQCNAVATTGGLQAIQTVFNLVNTTPCSGTYYPNGSAGEPYNLCPNGAASGTGLWRQNDIVLVINYFGGYPPTPETMTSSGGIPVVADSATGMLYWALHQ